MKKASSSRKKKVAAKPKPRPKKSSPAPKKKTGARKKSPAAPKKKTGARKKSPAAPKKKTGARMPVPVARASERAMAVAAQRPEERALTDEERDAMGKVAQTALAMLAANGDPAAIVVAIAAFVDDVRVGRRPEPDGQDVRLGLGVLWGEQVRAQVGWRWVHLSYPNGFASYALVPDDRAFACFPLNRVTELMRAGGDGTTTSVALFDSIRVGTLPARHDNAYLVIG